MLHKLKRTLAVTCLLATAVLVILWMRSYSRWDYVGYEEPEQIYSLASRDGIVEFVDGAPWIDSDDAKGYYVTSILRPGHFKHEQFFRTPIYHPHELGLIIHLPYWLAGSITAVVATLMLLRKPVRFSLRTLAIAATLIVLALGMGVAASRLTLG